MPQALSLQEVDIQPDFDGAYLFQEAEIINEAKRIVGVTLISVGPGNTRDKNFYSQEAITGGATLFDGVKCYANHPSALDQKIQPERRVQDIIGFFTEVKPVGEQLKANLNIFSGADCDWAWDRIKAAIAYAKKYPGRNLIGLSINARGTQESMDYQGEQWKNVTQFLEVRSVDLVTTPARGGKVEEVLAESDATGASAADILNAMKAKILELSGESYPGMEDLRRQCDQLGTAMQANKTEGEPMPDDKKKDEPKGDEMNFAQMAATFKKMAESEKDTAKKEAYMQAEANFTKQAEAKVEADKDAEKAEAEKVKKEAEAKKEADKSKTESEKKESEIKELRAELIETKTEKFMEEAGLSEAQQSFISNLLEGVEDLSKIEKTIKDYAATTLKESAQRKPHNFPKTLKGGSTAKTGSVADRLAANLA